ncbi:MAG: hypothetical protein LEGION0398_MBIBDBAK_00213 [Legionellaceae bacterium]
MLILNTSLLMNLDLSKISHDFLCPLTNKIMLEPVSDDLLETYEKEAIEEWFKKCKNGIFITPHTKEILDNNQVKNNRRIKEKISTFLEKNPDYWQIVYISKEILLKFETALKNQDKDELAKLVTVEPRLASENNYQLLKWAIEAKDEDTLVKIILPALNLCGQQKHINNIALLVAQNNWLRGFECLIESNILEENDIFEYMKEWIAQSELTACKLLLFIIQKTNVDINKTDIQGNTLLHLAVINNNPDMVTALLMSGIDEQITNQEGKTAQEIAAVNHETNIINLFIQSGDQNKKLTGLHSSNAQLQLLKNEVFELKQDIIQLQNTIKQDMLQHKKEQKQQMNHLITGLQKAAFSFFSNIKNDAQQNTIKIIIERVRLNDIHILPNENIVASVGNEIKIWSSKNGRCIQTIRDSGELSTLPNNKIVCYSITNKTLKIWDTATGECLQTLADTTENNYSTKSFSGFNFGSTQKFSSQPNNTFDLRHIATLHKDKILTISNDKITKIWDSHTGTCLKTLHGIEPGRCIATFPDGRFAIGYYNPDNTLKLYDSNTGKTLLTLRGHTYHVVSIIVLKDGRIASASWDGTVKIWDSTTGQCLLTLSQKETEFSFGGGRIEVECLTELPGGLLASGSRDAKIKIWNTTTGECVEILNNHTNWVEAIASFPDGRIISSSKDESLILRTTTANIVASQGEKFLEENLTECKIM